MIAVTFNITALEPLLLTRLVGDPNSAVSFPYIPGSALRGALINQYRTQAAGNLTDDPTASQLFFNGAVRYLNAYPLRQGERTRPAPLTFTPTHKRSGRLDDQLLCRIDGVEVEPVETPWQISVHTARERVKGRATRAEGAVFRYQAIAAAERFGGLILCPDQTTADRILSLLDGELWVGGSRSAGYGCIQIDRAQSLADTTEYDSVVTALNPGDHLVITLLSAAIVRDDYGACVNDLAPDRLPEPIGLAVNRVAAFKRLTLIGSFNRAWGLPTEQVPALAGGSVFVYQVTQPIAAAELRALELNGLGERRAEGFGRVRVGDPYPVQWTELPAVSPEREAEEAVLTDADRAVLAAMVKRLARRELDRRLAEYVQTRDLGRHAWPSKAQLSRLRAVTLNALPGHNVARVQTFLERLRARARDQYDTARLDGGRLLTWLKHRVDEPAGIWNLLAVTNDVLPQIGEAKIDLSAEPQLAQDYTLRLIAAVLHRAAKEQSS